MHSNPFSESGASCSSSRAAFGSGQPMDFAVMKNFTINDGLNGYSVWSMLEDSAGHVWIGTRNAGLTRFDGNRFETLSE